ncbi:hypothetical protein GS399_17570 [Pedobacter sp. HMF7647]|uniref:DUF479 domain-containing protein n=1 Tax=Hufsiella arboris TaxID=2695275 RepID=A0A7K1YDW4_9SPHI|nr:hypothetical protein [Hufsiella arboris]MXV52785.1 hypothetical protein [Hufsiella arboris]
MNFLSHYYFDREVTNPERILGMVLPDLLKNANKKWVIHPNRHHAALRADKDLNNILEGWNRHLAVDAYFHSSDFFYRHTQQIRTAIAPLITDSPVRPSFLAHIGLELMLDSLLITQNQLDAHNFYTLIASVNSKKVDNFLKVNQIFHTNSFFDFFEEFISSAYLHSYSDYESITYALEKICMRLWNKPFTIAQKSQLTDTFNAYQEVLLKDYQLIFDQIESEIND